MATVSKFEDLEIWQLARQQANELYLLYLKNDFSRDFSLRNQINGSSGSVMDNIAEGFERSGNKEFLQFLYISKGSCEEFRSQLHRAIDRSYIDKDEFSMLYNTAIEIIMLLQKLINYLETSKIKGPKYKTR